MTEEERESLTHMLACDGETKCFRPGQDSHAAGLAFIRRALEGHSPVRMVRQPVGRVLRVDTEVFENEDGRTQRLIDFHVLAECPDFQSAHDLQTLLRSALAMVRKVA